MMFWLVGFCVRVQFRRFVFSTSGIFPHFSLTISGTVSANKLRRGRVRSFVLFVMHALVAFMWWALSSHFFCLSLSTTFYSCILVGTTHKCCIVSHIATMHNEFNQLTLLSFILWQLPAAMWRSSIPLLWKSRAFPQMQRFPSQNLISAWFSATLGAVVRNSSTFWRWPRACLKGTS